MKIFPLIITSSLVSTPLLSAEMKVVQQYPSLSPDYPVKLSFMQPMIEAQMVGKPALEGSLVITPALDVDTCWLSPTELEVRFKKEALPRTDYQLSYTKDAQQYVNTIRTMSSMRVKSPWEVYPQAPLFFRTDDLGLWEAPFRASLEGAYYCSSADKDKKIATKVRQATVADVKRYRKAAEECYSAMNKKEWEEFSALGDEVLVPNLWLADYYPYTAQDRNQSISLYLPGLGAYSARHQTYHDLCIASHRLPEATYHLLNKQLDSGEYQVTLILDAPVIMKEEMKELLTHIQWYQVLPSGKSFPMRYEDDMSYQTASMGEEMQREAERSRKEDPLGYVSSVEWPEEMRITLDEEKSAQYITPFILEDGSEVKAVERLVFHVKKGMKPCSLEISAKLPTLVGETIAPKKKTRVRTALAPDKPELVSEVSMSTLALEGKQDFSLSYSLLDKPTLRLMELSGRGESAAKVIAAYENYYSHYHDDSGYWNVPRTRGREKKPLATRSLIHHISESTSSKKIDTLVPTELLDTKSERVITLPEGENELHISLRDKLLFPDGKPGLYFLEIQGEVQTDAHHYFDKDWNSDDPHMLLVSQGIIQVTNIGMIWKVDKEMRKFYVYGFELSTAKQLTHARLSLYSSDAKLLHEQDMPTDGVMLDLVELLGKKAGEVAYIQLSTSDDSFTTPFNNEPAYDHHHYQDMVDAPQVVSYVFTDRALYRPGETAHLKGFVRQLFNNEISIPSPEFIKGYTARLSFNGEDVEYDVELQKDGSFSLDIPIPEHADTGACYIYFKAITPSDLSYQSPDLVTLGVTEESRESFSENYYLRNFIESNRIFSSTIYVEHYRRNEFEIEGGMKLMPDMKEVELVVDAQQMNGTPLVGGTVSWSLSAQEMNFYPRGLKDYRFGDYRKGDYGYYECYYWNRDDVASGTTHFETIPSGKLDADGKSMVKVTRPQGEFPRRQLLTSEISVTNTRGQRLSTSREQIVDPAELYVGMKQASSHSAANEEGLAIDLLTVNVDGQPIASPHAITVKAQYETTSSYSYGSLIRQMLRHHSEVVELESQTVTLNEKGEGRVIIPTDQAGIYTITAEGVDAKGRPFRSAIVHHVYGKMEKGYNWKQESPDSMDIITDKDIYQPHETVKLLLKTPLDGEIILTVFREGMLRQLRQKVTKEKPVIELALEADDSPLIDITAHLVQGTEESGTGKARVLTGSTRVMIDPVDKKLKINLDLPSTSVLPGESCMVKGQVLDASGQPASHAMVTLYAEDEGSLQAGGYVMPNPVKRFYSWRPTSELSFSSLGKLLSENHKHRYYGNKGVFVGGGFAPGVAVNAYMGESAGGIFVRDNFAPCALWLAQVQTDAEGRFSSVVKNPDTLTRYRVIAVASHGEDRFGTDYGHYQVNKPIMLEPTAPLSACKGDVVHIPVTITMLPDELPDELQAQDSVTWKLHLKGNEAVDILQAEQTVTLDSNASKTLYFPVNMKQLGTARFEWSVLPADTLGGKLDRYGDAVADSVTVRPATPFLRESLFVTIPPDTEAKASQWLKTDFNLSQTRLNLTLSPSPISAYTSGIDMLNSYPYTCTEQLSSRAIPLIYAEDFHRAVGSQLPSRGKRQAELNKLLDSILERRIGSSSHFSYWGDSDSPSEFGPYVYLVLSLAREKNLLPREMEYAFRDITQRVIKNISSNLSASKDDESVLLWLYALARQKDLTMELFTKLISEHAHDWNSPQEILMTMHIAQLLQDGKLSAIHRQTLAQIKPSEDSNYILPSFDTLKLMIEIQDNPASDATAQRVAEHVGQHASSPYHNTLSNAWQGIMLAHYIAQAKLTDSYTVVNGQKLLPGSPLSYMKQAIDSLPSFNVTEGKTYATALVEGYVKNEQPDQLVDKGFHVQRRYEKLLPDGRWTATAEFNVGDIVRVTIQARANQASRYVALEDYLPAGMEAINPEVTGQALPNSIAQQRDHCWFAPSWVTRREFLKDRVRFFMNSWSSDAAFEVSYLVNVSMAGEMKAPAAKAEEMYRPQVYGLAQPLKITIKP